MEALAEGVWQLDGTPRDGINVYVIGDVLVDAGTMLDRRRILRQLDGRTISAHALTHAHPDHYGSSRAAPATPRTSPPAGCSARLAGGSPAPRPIR
jgi:glyoxylase-like metal-dependent hydrolase (beta-lactamase superfamily II)